MRAASLFGVLTVAHLLMLAGHSMPVSLWTPAAYVWQDLLMALLFAAVDHAMKRPKPAWALYAILALYSAVNVPIARILSSPLTWPMMTGTVYVEHPKVGRLSLDLQRTYYIEEIVTANNFSANLLAIRFTRGF